MRSFSFVIAFLIPLCSYGECSRLGGGKTKATFTANLGNVCQRMWNSAGNNLKIGQDIVIYAGIKPHPLITLTKLGKAKMKRDIFVKFKALLDNYEADENRPEKTNATELLEEDALIDAMVVSGGPMDIAFQYLKEQGSISFNCLDQFKPVLKKMWFEKYAKRRKGPHFSGFEHTFVGEVVYDWKTKQRITTGFHNWIQFLSEKQTGRLTYSPPPLGRSVNTEPALVRARFQWGGASKPPGSSFFIGTSPAFEMALYTACFFQSSTCTCQINGKPLTITSVNFNKKGYVLTAFPRF